MNMDNPNRTPSPNLIMPNMPQWTAITTYADAERPSLSDQTATTIRTSLSRPRRQRAAKLKVKVHVPAIIIDGLFEGGDYRRGDGGGGQDHGIEVDGATAGRGNGGHDEFEFWREIGGAFLCRFLFASGGVGVQTYRNGGTRIRNGSRSRWIPE